MNPTKNAVNASNSTGGAPCDTCMVLAVVEDDAQCRQALMVAAQGCSDMRLAWHSSNLQEALAALPTQPIDVLVVDLGLPDGSGIEVIEAARCLQPHCAIMVHTVFGDEAHILPAIAAGALGYMLKDTSPQDMMAELRSLHAGGSPIHPMVARKLLLSAASPPPAALAALRIVGDTKPPVPHMKLSERELTVLQLVSQGYSFDEAAQALTISAHTVRTYVRRIYEKLQVSTRAEAIRIATAEGLIDP